MTFILSIAHTGDATGGRALQSLPHNERAYLSINFGPQELYDAITRAARHRHTLQGIIFYHTNFSYFDRHVPQGLFEARVVSGDPLVHRLNSLGGYFTPSGQMLPRGLNQSSTRPIVFFVSCSWSSEARKNSMMNWMMRVWHVGCEEGQRI